MKNRIHFALAVVMIALSSQFALAAKDKVPDVPTAPDVIEVPGGVYSESYVIETPGAYRLAGERTLAPGANVAAIVVRASNVTLDLGGHTLQGTGAGDNSYGVWTRALNGGSVDNVEVTNGTVQGFGTGILMFGRQNAVMNVRSLANTNGGILVEEEALIENCVASENGSYGISIDTGRVTKCIAGQNGIYGVLGGYSVVEDSLVSENGVYGVYSYANSTIRGCQIIANNQNGDPSGAGVKVGNSGVIEGNQFAQNAVRSVDIANGSVVNGNTFNPPSTGVCVETAYNGAGSVAVASRNVFVGNVDALVGGILDKDNTYLLSAH